MPSSGWLSSIRRHIGGETTEESSGNNFRQHHNIVFTNDLKNANNLAVNQAHSPIRVSSASRQFFTQHFEEKNVPLNSVPKDVEASEKRQSSNEVNSSLADESLNNFEAEFVTSDDNRDLTQNMDEEKYSNKSMDLLQVGSGTMRNGGTATKKAAAGGKEERSSHGRLLRSQSQVFNATGPLSPDSLLNLGLNRARPMSAVSRLSIPKEILVRSKVTVTNDQSTSPEVTSDRTDGGKEEFLATQYTAPGYARPFVIGQPPSSTSLAHLPGQSQRPVSSRHQTTRQGRNPVPTRPLSSTSSGTRHTNNVNNNHSVSSSTNIATQISNNPPTNSATNPDNVYSSHIAEARILDASPSRPTPALEFPSSDGVTSPSGEVTSPVEGVISSPFNRPTFTPLYPQISRPSPSVSSCPTPMFDNDPKRVRFVEPRGSAPSTSRPASATSQYSNIIKNSTRYLYQPSQAFLDTFGHDPRICNCPCHFLPTIRRRSVAVQAWPLYVNGRLAAGRTAPLKPRHSRLYFLPSAQDLRGLGALTQASSVLLRVLLSQVGVAMLLALWWWVGALIFSALEAPIETALVERVAHMRSQIVIELATDLRKVVPYDTIWRSKIAEYAEKLEAGVLEAVRAGYSSSTQHWTIPGALVYASCLTALLGPSGAVVRSNITRFLSLPYTLVGGSLLLLLSVSAAHLLREAVAILWCCRRSKRKVQDKPLMGVEVSSPPKIVRTTPRPTIGVSKVPTIDETLQRNIDTRSTDEEFGTISSFRNEQGSATQVRNHLTNSSVENQSSSANVPNPSPTTLRPVNGNLHSAYETSVPQPVVVSRAGAPSIVFLIFLFLHCGIWIALLYTVFELPNTSSIQGVVSSVLMIDSGNWLFNGIPSWFLSGPFPIFLLITKILSLALLLSWWPNISEFFRYTGKELNVTTPVLVRS